MQEKHPLSYFQYCPHCGSSSFHIHNFKSKRCSACGFVYYLNPSAACAAVVCDEADRLLVAVRANEPGRGMYDLPGGFSDAGENSETSMLRELEEEVGPALVEEASASMRYLFTVPNGYVYSNMDIPTMDLFFEMRVHSLSRYVGEGMDDVKELLAIPLSNIDLKRFAFSSVREALHRYLEMRRFPEKK